MHHTSIIVNLENLYKLNNELSINMTQNSALPLAHSSALFYVYVYVKYVSSKVISVINYY